MSHLPQELQLGLAVSLPASGPAKLSWRLFVPNGFVGLDDVLPRHRHRRQRDPCRRFVSHKSHDGSRRLSDTLVVGQLSSSTL